jgi:P-type conjugative transfer protein TrbJ
LVILTWLFLLTVAPSSWAQWAVIDASNLVQTTITAYNSVQTAVNTAREVANTYQQIRNQYEQIRNQVTQIENQARNLQRFDLTSVDAVLGMGQSIVGVLNTAQGVSFQLDQARAQFEQVYPQVRHVLSPRDALRYQAQWAAHLRQAAATGAEIQALTQDVQTTYGRLCALLQSAAAAQGNLDISQIHAQLLGVLGAQILKMQQIEAGNGRITAQAYAQDAALQEATVRAIEAAAVPTAAYTQARGRLITYRYR